MAIAPGSRHGHEEDPDWNPMPRDRRLDRYIEANLGARLRFQIDRELVDPFSQAYWQGVYRRWSQLYHRRGPDGL